MESIFSVIGLAILGSFVGLVGGIVFLFNKKWSDWLSRNSIPFAAGVLLTVSLVGLLPESYHMIGEQAFIVVLLSFLVGYVFEHSMFDIHHHEGHTHQNVKSSIPLVIIGDTIHNFIDGVAIAASYFVSPGLGFVTALSTLLHEVPHEIGDFGILLKAGWEKKKILLVNVLSASTTILGALFVIYISRDTTITGYLLGIASGLFLYLGASDFLPHLHEGEENSKINMIYLLAGVFIMLLTFAAVPHNHPENDTTNSDVHSDEQTSLKNDQDSIHLYEQ